mgnify:CR=1 FL=1
MTLPSFSVKRPIFTTMVTLILVILGAVSLSRLQIDMLPNIELPTLSIRTNYELSLIHISEPTRLDARSRMPSSA